MGVDDLYASESNWLTAAELKNKEHNVTIDKIEVVEVKDDSDKAMNKLQVSFVGKEKTLLLNKTNAKVIAAGLGDDYSDWPGKGIVMYPTVCDFAGKTVDCIRVRVKLEAAGEGEEIPF